MLNRVCGLLAEFGPVLPLRAAVVRRRALLEKLPTRVAHCVRDLLEHAVRLDAKVLDYEQEIRSHVRTNALAQRAQTRRGIGPITASALVVKVGNAQELQERPAICRLVGLSATAMLNRR